MGAPTGNATERAAELAERGRGAARPHSPARREGGRKPRSEPASDAERGALRSAECSPPQRARFPLPSSCAAERRFLILII